MMGTPYKNLKDLRQKKALLKAEVSEMQNLLTFKNTKDSLGTFTNGATDKFLINKVDKDGKQKTTLDKANIMQYITKETKNKLIHKNPYYGIANNALTAGPVQDALQLALVATIGNMAKKNVNSKSWKKKILGAVLIYVIPIGLRFLRKKLEEYQKNKSVSSMEKLI